METKAELKYLRIAPRKTRLVVDMIRGKKVEEAPAVLSFAVKKGADPILKLLNSAVASAKNNFQADPANLYIGRATVDEGPKYKRWRPRSRGMAHGIEKKTSHVRIVLEELVEGKKAKAKVEKKDTAAVQNSEEPNKKVKTRANKPTRHLNKETEKPKERKGIKKFFRRKSI